jgi:hypothetical protein
MLSSYQPKMGTCVRKVKQRGKWTAQNFNRPDVVAHYNSAMGGTDLHDMRLAFMRSSVKSCRWQVRVFIDMISSMLINAYTLKCLKEKRKRLHKYSEFDFIAEYLRAVAPLPADDVEEDAALPSVHPATYTCDDGSTAVRKCKRPFWDTPAGVAWRLDGKAHYADDANKAYPQFSKLANGQTRINAKAKQIRLNLRRNCRCCNRDTVYFCTKCETPLCLGECFVLFHTKKKLPALTNRVRK